MRLNPRTAILAAALALGAFSIGQASADPMSAARKGELAKLPDWSGVWGLRSSGKLADPAQVQRKDMRDNPPYKPAWEARYKSDLVKAQNQGVGGVTDQVVNTHTIYCVAGMPRNMANGFDRFYMITPDVAYLTVGGEMRVVYTDGRAFPSEDKANPKYQGWSIGHWDGETLAIETRYMKAGMWGGQTPLLFSEKAVVFERLTKIDNDTIKNEVTINDPVAFTTPWKFTREYKRRDFAERWSDEKEICIDEGDRHPITGGTMATVIPGGETK